MFDYRYITAIDRAQMKVELAMKSVEQLNNMFEYAGEMEGVDKIITLQHYFNMVNNAQNELEKVERELDYIIGLVDDEMEALGYTFEIYTNEYTPKCSLVPDPEDVYNPDEDSKEVE